MVNKSNYFSKELPCACQPPQLKSKLRRTQILMGDL
jgi:hypothetical protein